MAKKLNDQGRKAQVECLRAKGYAADADAVARGDVDFDPDDLEMLDPDDGSGIWKTRGHL